MLTVIIVNTFLWKGKGGNPSLVKVLLATRAPSPEEEREQSWLVCGRGELCLGLPLLLVRNMAHPHRLCTLWRAGVHSHMVLSWLFGRALPYGGL